MWKQIFKTTIIAGCLDIIAACIQSYILKSSTPDKVLKYIASGVFGKAATSGGFEFGRGNSLCLHRAACYFFCKTILQQKEN